MHSKMKKIVARILAWVMLLQIMPFNVATAFAATLRSQTINGMTYYNVE